MKFSVTDPNFVIYKWINFILRHSIFKSGPSWILNSHWLWFMYGLDSEGKNISTSVIIAIIGCNFVINNFFFHIGQNNIFNS
jgi:hypothetical protein